MTIFSAPVLAQGGAASKSEPLDPAQIRARAQRVKDLRALLADPDQNVRLSALDEMLKSSDPVMQEIAFESGFASADNAMRAVALRAKLGRIKGFAIEIQPPKDADKKVLEMASQFGGTVAVTIKTFDPATGKMELDTTSR